MNIKRINIKLVALILFGALAMGARETRADGVSYTGTLASSTDTFQATLTLSSASSVALQTFGFGGGVNQAGASIAAGGTDPFLAIFSGTGAGAMLLTDAFANGFATSLDLSNYGGFAGCPNAGTQNIGGSATCGDVRMSLGTLSAGTYTVLLSDGQYIANAVFDNGTLGEGFTDLTGGQFCNLSINGTGCSASGAYALDVITSSSVTATPEPSSLLLLGAGIIPLTSKMRRRRSAARAQK
jgi:hypothetical protein